jgi:hypothetical protein
MGGKKDGLAAHTQNGPYGKRQGRSDHPDAHASTIMENHMRV